MSNVAYKVQNLRLINNVECRMQNAEPKFNPAFLDFDFSSIDTPAYLIFEELLKRNLEILASVQEETNVKILLAQKCFSMYYSERLHQDCLRHGWLTSTSTVKITSTVRLTRLRICRSWLRYVNT